jgi:hypothetical protein
LNTIKISKYEKVILISLLLSVTRIAYFGKIMNRFYCFYTF